MHFARRPPQTLDQAWPIGRRCFLQRDSDVANRVGEVVDEVVGLRLGDAAQADHRCRDDDVEGHDRQATRHAETHQRGDERLERVREEHADEERDEDRFAFSQHEDAAGDEKEADR